MTRAVTIDRPRWTTSDVDARGNTRWWLRLPPVEWQIAYPGEKWRKIRLPGKPGQMEFHDAYKRGCEGFARSPITATPAPSKGTVGALCANYLASVKFKELDWTYKKVTRRRIEKLTAEFGDIPAEGFQPKHVKAIQNRLKNSPGPANAMTITISQIFKLGIEDGLVEHNPASGIQRVKPLRHGGYVPWEEVHIARSRSRWPLGTKARLMLCLLLYPMCRRSDAIRLGPHNIDAKGNLSFVQFKGRKNNPGPVDMPFPPELRQAIDLMPPAKFRFTPDPRSPNDGRERAPQTAFLLNQHGRPYSFYSSGFGDQFRRYCDAAGLPRNLSAHGIRKRGAERLAEAGASEHQIMKYGGWRSSSMVKLYTEKVDALKITTAAASLLPSEVEVVVELAKVVKLPDRRTALSQSPPVSLDTETVKMKKTS